MLLSDDDSGCPIEEYAWTPPGCTIKQIQQYFSGWPEELIPYVESPGDRYRCCQLLKQLPPQDNEIRYCSNLDDDEKQELLLFAKERKEKALGRAIVRSVNIKQNIYCHGCNEILTNIGVFANKNGFETAWHPQCFKCESCNEMLVDLIFFADGQNLYCGRHHAEKLKPRCSNCDEIIFCEECTEAEGLFWHTHHFVCSTCNCALGGQRYIMRDQKPYCTTCFEADYAVKCAGCSGMIGLHVGQVEYGGQSWHADPKCFKCETCATPLLNRSFLPKFGYVFCSHKCSVGFENRSNGGVTGVTGATNNLDQIQSKFLPHQLVNMNNTNNKNNNNNNNQGLLTLQITDPIRHLSHQSGHAPSIPPTQSFYNKTFENNGLSTLNNNQAQNQNQNPVLYESINLGRDLNILNLPDRATPETNTTAISNSKMNSVIEKNSLEPPVPPKRTDSRLSSHSSNHNFPNPPTGLESNRQDSGISNTTNRDEQGSQTNNNNNNNSHTQITNNTTNNININNNTLNKSVNFSTYPVNSDTSSICDGATTIGNQSTIMNTTSVHSNITNTTVKDTFMSDNKPKKSILKNSGFNRNNVFGSSMRRKDDEGMNKSFDMKSRRVRSIDQDLNKSWGGGRDPYKSGYYSDAGDYPSDSSSTIGDSDDNDHDIGDWEREAIALASSKINSKTPTSRKDRKNFISSQNANITQMTEKTKKGQHIEINHANYSHNLDQFEKASKKLKKQRKKQKKMLEKGQSKRQKHGKPCAMQ